MAVFMNINMAGNTDRVNIH